jgi:hypothetical protein
MRAPATSSGEAGRTRFDHTKSERELGVTFRPVEQTLADEVQWYRDNGWLRQAPRTGSFAGKRLNLA